VYEERRLMLLRMNLYEGGSWEEFGVREVSGLVEVRGSVTQN
jgi:hypothetical protein